MTDLLIKIPNKKMAANIILENPPKINAIPISDFGLLKDISINQPNLCSLVTVRIDILGGIHTANTYGI